MKIGLLAYSTNTGLGYQTLEFFENMNPSKVLIADLSRLNGVQTHHERFLRKEGDTHEVTIDFCNSTDYLDRKSCEWLIDGMDIIFMAETPLNHYILEYARKQGVKTVIQYNYEFLSYFRKNYLPKPDVLASPSMWGIEQVERQCWAETIHWPVPINIDRFEYRSFQKVETFVHIIGRPAAMDRNGSVTFLEAAMRLDDYKFKVYLQRPKEGRTISHFREVNEKLIEAKKKLGGKLEIIEDVEDNREMYSSGEVLVLPRRYGGLCLPMWEALSAGMPVIMPDVTPNNTILPKSWLVEAYPNGSFMAHTYITMFDVKVENLVLRMNAMAKGNIAPENKKAREIAEDMSWKNQRPKYIQRFKELCE